MSLLDGLCLIRAILLTLRSRYGPEFIQHSYTYHLTRIDHRHNFSVYNTLLHMRSALGPSSGIGVESLAFLPQMLLSVLAIPLLLAKRDLASTMLAQTFAFVTFNKVCTSQVCFSTINIRSFLNDFCLVLSLVHGLPAILPSELIAHPPTQAGIYSSSAMGYRPGSYSCSSRSYRESPY